MTYQTVSRPSKDKGVFTINVKLDNSIPRPLTPKQQDRQAGMQMLNPSDEQLQAAVKNADLSSLSNINQLNQSRTVDALAMPLPSRGKPWTKEEIRARAHEMVELLEDRAVELPEALFLGASESDREKVRDFVYNLGIEIFRRLEKADEFEFFSDGDGTMYYKNPIMTDSTCSFASKHDRHWNTTLAQCLYYLGTQLTVLTARPGAFAGQSLVGVESPINNVGRPNATSPEEISACIGTKRAEMDAFNVNIRGLNGALHSDVGEPLKLTPQCQNFNKLFNFLDKEFGIVDELLKIRHNDGDSLRVLEFKAVPAAFRLMSDLTLQKYQDYMELAQKARDEKWSSQVFVDAVAKLGINFTPELQKLLNPSDLQAETKLTEVLRDAHGGITHFTPHCIDGKNVYRQDIRAKFYNLLIHHLRDPKTKAWLEKEFKIPQDCDVITINGKDISHITDFSKCPDLSAFIKDIDAKGSAPKHKNILVSVADNDQFYLEVGASNTKDQVIKRYKESLDTNTLSVMRGDSAGTDAPAIAQAVISGGVGVIVRGLMSRIDIGNRMVELLSQNPADGSYVNEGHPDCLKEIKKDIYQHLDDGRIKTKKEWAEELADKYKSQILQIDNIHLNNAAFAFLFTKFLEKEKLPFEPAESRAKRVEEPNQLRNRTLTTPDIGFIERGISKYVTPGQMSSVIKTLTGLPVIGSLFKIENSRTVLTSLINYLGYGMLGAGLVGMPATFFSPAVESVANGIQRACAIVGSVGSGITRGLRAPTIYPGQFIGELFMIGSSASKPNSFLRNTLWAMGNGLLQLGRAGSTMASENLILDTYKKGTEEKRVKEVFGDQYDNKANLRQAANKFSIARSYWIDKFKPMFGEFISMGIADVINGLKMTWEFFAVKGYRHGALTSLWKNAGFTKTSMTSGKDYTSVASAAHLYSATGILGMGTSLLSMVTHKLNNKWLDWLMGSLASFIPTIGVIAAARNVKQDQHGHIRLFTDTVGREAKFDPEKAGWWQLVGGQIMAVSSFLQGHAFGSVLQLFGLGAYYKGISQEFNPVSEMGAVNTLRKEQKYAEASADHKTADIIEHTQQFFNRAKNVSLAKAVAV